MIKKINHIKDFCQACFYIRRHFKKFQIIKIYRTFSNLVVQFRGEGDDIYIFKLFKNHFLYYERSEIKNLYSVYAKYSLSNKEIVIENNYVIVEFLPNQKDNNNWIAPLAQSFGILHQIPTQDIKEKVNIKALIQYYESLIKVLPQSFLQTSAKILSNLEQKPKLLVYCHNDFSWDNFVIYKNKSYFIDIEYSAVNDIFFELATIKINLQDKFDEFLDIYLTQNPKYKIFIKDHIKNLKQMEYIVLYIGFLWFTILGDGSVTKLYKEKLQDYETL